jgi:hypothetical protein
MTVKEVRDKLNEVVGEGNGDLEFVVCSTVEGFDGEPLVDVHWLEKPTEVSGFNIPYSDWPICAWSSETRRYDMTGDEAKEVN